MAVELLIAALLAQQQITVRVRRPPREDIDGALVEMDNGGSVPITRRTIRGIAIFPGRCTRNLKFTARMPHPPPAYLSNPSAPRDCTHDPVELLIRPPRSR